MDALEPKRALELAARCVVETGTSSFYTTLAESDREPVLTQLAARIRADEIRHYKNFYRFFLKYCERERPSRGAVLKTLLKRAAEVESEDALIAFKHVHLTCNPGAAFQRSDYDSYRDSVRQIAKFHFPQEMAVKMMLKPLGVGARAGRIAVTTHDQGTLQHSDRRKNQAMVLSRIRRRRIPRCPGAAGRVHPDDGLAAPGDHVRDAGGGSHHLGQR